MFTHQNHQQTSQESAPEKVLRLALNLPHTQNDLELEAARIERLLDNLSQPMTQTGEELQDQLAYAMESLLEGIFALLEAETKDHFDGACGAVLQCHALVQDLQETLCAYEDEALLVA